MIEREPRRRLDAHEAFAEPLALMFERAVMAVRIIPRLAEEDVRRPGASRAALVGVVTALAEAPEIIRRAIAREAKLFRRVPDLANRSLARVTAEALTVAGHPFTTEQVREEFDSPATAGEAQEDFRQARRWGIKSFPALLAQVGAELRLVTPGFLDADGIREALSAARSAR